MCKGADGKVGLRVQTVNNGVFVCVVVKGSPAALAGLRFGDQILQVNGVIVAGYTMDQVHKLFKESPINGISVVVRDRYVSILLHMLPQTSYNWYCIIYVSIDLFLSDHLSVLSPYTKTALVMLVFISRMAKL